MLLEALDAGYRLLDTAAMYGDGDNESLIGRVLQGRRRQFVLASKGGLSKGPDGAPLINGRPEVLKRACEVSLKRLQTEVIDLYYLHRLDPDVAVEESVGALGELVSEGKVRSIGLSEVCSDTLRRAHQEFPITALQSEYSLWSRTPERAVLAACAELGVAFVTFSPLGRGFLAGSAHDVSGLSEGDIRLSIARPRFETDNFRANLRLLEPIRALAEQQGCSLAQLALAWLLSKSEQPGQPVIVPIPGTKELAHMHENILAVEIELSSAVVAQLDGLIDDEQVAGSRYSDVLMAAVDSERD